MQQASNVLIQAKRPLGSTPEAAAARRSSHRPAAPNAHRRDIDGLRALAVLPVVAFHANIHFISGGFVGVDVFFVISGFLITQLLHGDICAGRFSLAHFYERRIRRIAPALLAVLLAVQIAGFLLSLPSELVSLSWSVVAEVLSVSNVYFWLTSGYFDGESLTKPLLHTWSLAVEEQFYLIWPLLLLALHRVVRARLLVVVAGLTAASLLASIVGVRLFPNAAFYLPFMRAWELALGALLALGAFPAPLRPLQREVLAGLGTLLILGSVLLIHPDESFPGLLAIPPCLGAALVILAGRDGQSRVGRLLSLPPVAFVGLISYSLYLWHWPIIVLQRQYGLVASGWTESATKLLIIAVSLAAAVLSWRFIEQPFRAGSLRPSRGRLLQMAAAGGVAVLGLASLALGAGGFPGRYSPLELQVASYLEYGPHAGAVWREGRCFVYSDSRDGFAPECLALASDRKNYLLLGDSHAAELWQGLEAAFPGTQFLEATATDCFPTIAHSRTEAAGCIRMIDDVLQSFLPRHRLDGVLLVARWKSALLPNVEATVAWMKERHIPVILVGPSARYDAPFPRLLMEAMRAADETLPARHLDAGMRPLDAAMSRLAQSQGVPYVSLLNLQCVIPSCAIEPGERPLIFDGEHYTPEGARIIAERLRDATTGAAAQLSQAIRAPRAELAEVPSEVP
jgi:peptidoglycan/LPS O-acetylase OafA/YrhL